MINVSEPIKKIGDYKAKVTLYKEIKTSIDIKVVAEK
jgi:ribosomal protein L9